MKKMLLMLLALVMVFGFSVAQADDLGVQVIGGANGAVETLSLEDMKLGESYKIAGYATVKPLDFSYIDFYAQYQVGKNGDTTLGYNSFEGSTYVNTGLSSAATYIKCAEWKDSGATADFAFLTIDLVNLRKEEMKFMAEATVKVVYDEEYEFTGWVRQANYDYFKEVSYVGPASLHAGHDALGNDAKAGPVLLLDPGAEEPVNMMYTGHYVFGCTLPNEVITAKEPLRMVITLGDNELIYNIRK